jgi:hypothetical protein
MLNYIYMKFMNKFLACINYLNKHFKECKHKSKSRSMMCRVCKVELRHKFLNAHNKNNRESSNQESGCVNTWIPDFKEDQPWRLCNGAI